MAIEARVGAHREWPRPSGSAHPADGLGQEARGTADGVRASLAQAGHEHITAAGCDREQRVVAANVGIRVMPGALLLQAVRLADGRVEVDGQGTITGSGTRRPCPSERLPADSVELAHVAPAEAAQERAQRGGCLDVDARDPSGATGAQGVGVVDAVAARERGEHEAQELVADVGPAHRVAQVEVLIDELLQAQVLHQGGRQQEPGIGHQAVIVEGRVESVEAVR